MKLIADPIYVPDNADYATIEDAKLSANWHSVKSREERMAETDLTDKCGSCKAFCYWRDNSCYGECTKGHPYGQRTRRKCNDYERIEG